MALQKVGTMGCREIIVHQNPLTIAYNQIITVQTPRLYGAVTFTATSTPNGSGRGAILKPRIFNSLGEAVTTNILTVEWSFTTAGGSGGYFAYMDTLSNGSIFTIPPGYYVDGVVTVGWDNGGTINKITIAN